MATSDKPYLYQCPECGVDVAFNNHAPGCPIIPEQKAGGEKLSNPKDIIGSNKVPLSIVPGTTKAYLAIGHLEGMLKYGYVNWREAGVRTSIYLDALERHVEKFKNGEWCDAETKVPHLANAIACLSIIIDAFECGKLTDDRPKQAPVADVLERLADNVKHLREIYGHCNPKHYTYEPEGPNCEASADMYDGPTEKWEDNNRQGVIEDSLSAYCQAGRYPSSPSRAAVSKSVRAFCEGDLGRNDTQSVPERASGGYLRRDKLFPTGERLSPLGELAHRVLRSSDAGGDLPATSNSNKSAGPSASDSSYVGSKRIFDER